MGRSLWVIRFDSRPASGERRSYIRRRVYSQDAFCLNVLLPLKSSLGSGRSVWVIHLPLDTAVLENCARLSCWFHSYRTFA